MLNTSNDPLEALEIVSSLSVTFGFEGTPPLDFVALR